MSHSFPDLVSAAEPVQAAAAASLDSLYDMLLNGGPVMIPIGLCSVIALTYSVERAIRMAPNQLGTKGFGKRVVAGVRESGAQGGLELCRAGKSALARVFSEGFRHAADELRMEKAMEDAGAREVKRLSANLRPLVVVAVISPLLGLLGTVWGLIQAFSKLAGDDALGKPELLASGISQALVTTAAGLAIAIPAQAVYYYFRGRIDRFVRHTEDLYVEVADVLHHGGGAPRGAPAGQAAEAAGAHS